MKMLLSIACALCTALAGAAEPVAGDAGARMERLADGVYAILHDNATDAWPHGNTGVVVGDDAVLVADTQATPAMAADVIRRIREVTDKPIKYVVLSHYHAVRVLGASGYKPEHIIASRDTYDLIVERGEADKASEIGRFPRLFQQAALLRLQMLRDRGRAPGQQGKKR